jgi:hypothetical protein
MYNVEVIVESAWQARSSAVRGIGSTSVDVVLA